MKNYRYLGMIPLLFILSFCQKSNDFSGDVEKNTPTPPQPDPIPEAPNIHSEPDVKNFIAEETPPAEAFQFIITAPDNGKVFKNTSIRITPSIYKDEPLAKNELEQWQFQIAIKNEQPLTDFGNVVPTEIDLKSKSGTTAIKGLFVRAQDGYRGEATLELYVDTKPPQSILSNAGTENDGSRKIYWSAEDDFGINNSRLILYACEKDFVFNSAQISELKAPPAECQAIHTGDDLIKAGKTITIPDIQLNGASYKSSVADIYLYCEDMVGHSDNKKLEITEGKTELILSSKSDGTSYTNKLSATPIIELIKIENGSTLSISNSENSILWPNYQQLIGVNSQINTNLFTPNPTISLQDKDGLHTIKIVVKEPAASLESNTIEIPYFVDRIDPVVSNVAISTPGGYLSKDNPVNINWDTTDQSGIKKQTLYIKMKDEDTYSVLGDVDGSQTSYSFPWTYETEKSFQIKVVATDLAGNRGESYSSLWVPQIFNAAVLTKSVSCFFCHLKIDGDIGGINFPKTIDEQSGQDLFINGSLFATREIPSELLGIASEGDRPNYDNSDANIFPKDSNGDGIPDFPKLDKNLLLSRMAGSLSGKNVSILNHHVGNVILDGSDQNNPFKINGEIYIEGDLIIKGYYQGIGTIYANNIYVVDDIVALNSPFPFSTNKTSALAEAREAIKAKKDGLYLAALDQMLVGDTDHALNGSVQLEDGKVLTADFDFTTSTPFSWISKQEFESLGRQAEDLKDNNGNTFNLISSLIDDPKTSEKLNIEVNRIDAYLYAQRILIWRSYANFLINGGFMSPIVSLVSSYPRSIFFNHQGVTPPNNPRTPGLDSSINVIRYDYRLRAGGKGFETVKEFFDQQ